MQACVRELVCVCVCVCINVCACVYQREPAGAAVAPMAVDVVVVWEEGSTLDSAAGRDLLKPPPIRPPLRPFDFCLVFAFGGVGGGSVCGFKFFQNHL